jgi:hypothetical protein
MPDSLKDFRLPATLNERLQELLDRQDQGEKLSPTEQQEAEALVDMAELLSLLQLRAQNASQTQDSDA